jgi:hypothetical protein
MSGSIPTPPQTPQRRMAELLVDKLKGSIRNQWSPKTRYCRELERLKKTTRTVSQNSVGRDTNQAPIEHKFETITYSRGAAVGRVGRRMVRATEKKAQENEQPSPCFTS